MNNTAKIKHHMDTLAKGYRRWVVPLLMLMWDIGFKTGGGSTAENVFNSLIRQPQFIATAFWAVLLSIAMDRRGKLMLNCLTDTSRSDIIGYIMKEHSLFSLLVSFTPLIYFGTKALATVTGGGVFDISFLLDIHGLFTLIALYDGIRAIKCNLLIKQQLGI